jgi:hypothetical protein
MDFDYCTMRIKHTKHASPEAVAPLTAPSTGCGGSYDRSGVTAGIRAGNRLPPTVAVMVTVSDDGFPAQPDSCGFVRAVCKLA